MVKKMLLAVIFVIVFIQPIFSGEIIRNYPDQDVTGDGIKEKIYTKESYNGGKTVWSDLYILKKTESGWKNIFPQEDNRYCEGKIRKMRTSISSNGGFKIDKFDYFAGSQILTYYTVGCKSSICGSFYKYNPKEEMFELYRSDITDKEYELSKLSSEIVNIINEFKGKTKFTRAYETAKKFWSALKTQKWQDARALCSGEDATRYASHFENEFKKRYNNDYSSVKNIIIYSYYGQYDDHELIVNHRDPQYIFPTADDNWNVNIYINIYFKVKWITGCGIDY